LADHQRKVWDDRIAGWRDALRNDRDIGSNGLMSNLSNAKGIIEEQLGPRIPRA
jgi:hypothetical protein